MSEGTLGSAVPEAGTVIAGKYRVTSTLGSGGMGLVLAAHHLLLDQPIAIKCLTPAALDYPDVIERFTREARAAAKIRSEHVARVIDVGEFDTGLPFIVLEYLEGEDLADHLARVGKLRVSTAVRFVLEACEVLAEAHAAGIVHRDIKPANLFIAKQHDRRRIIKVLDFGISKLTDEPVTKASAMLGTVTYMSPEQIRSAKGVDHRTDIWALGAVLYECLSGVAPFGGDSTATLMTAVLANAPTPLATLRPDLPEGLVEAVERCLRTDPGDRYESVLALATALVPHAKTEDRASVDTIRRVLGASIAPPSSGSGDGAISIPSNRMRHGVLVLHDDAGEVTNTIPFTHPEVLASVGPESAPRTLRDPEPRPSSSPPPPSARDASAASKEPTGKSERRKAESTGSSTTPPVESPATTDTRKTRKASAGGPPALDAQRLATYAGLALLVVLVVIAAARAFSTADAPPAHAAPDPRPDETAAPILPPPSPAPALPPVEPTSEATSDPGPGDPPAAASQEAPAAPTAKRPPLPVLPGTGTAATAAAPADAGARAAALDAAATAPAAASSPAPGLQGVDKTDPWATH